MTTNYNRRVWGAEKIYLNKKFFRYHHLNFGLKNLPKNGDLKMLDIGCGGGVLTTAFGEYRPNWQIIGVDISDISLKKAQEQISSNTKFLNANAYQLPFENEVFDGVVMFDVLEHLEGPVRAIKEVSRVLKKDGFFYLVVPIEGSIGNIYGLLYKMGRIDLKKIIGHVQHFTKGGIFKLLEGEKMVIQKKIYSYHFIYQLVNVAYFTILNFFRKDESFSLENEALKRGGQSKKVWQLVKTTLAVMINWESQILTNFPGQTLLVVSKKSGKNC